MRAGIMRSPLPHVLAMCAAVAVLAAGCSPELAFPVIHDMPPPRADTPLTPDQVKQATDGLISDRNHLSNETQAAAAATAAADAQPPASVPAAPAPAKKKKKAKAPATAQAAAFAPAAGPAQAAALAPAAGPAQAVAVGPVTADGAKH